MLSLADKSIVVIGGSRGVGRRIVETAARSSARELRCANWRARRAG
jgi:NAD(P)-dependent dehydrogenase (short-subunit alcohol dehydrogenase family)